MCARIRTITHTEVPDTVMAMMAPMTDHILGPIDDSNGVLFGMAVFMATNIGVIMALFDDLWPRPVPAEAPRLIQERGFISSSSWV